MTEGEEFIAEYLTYNKIDFLAQYEIHFLKGDDKKYRKADFYLPKYKVYLEFEGAFNSDSYKDRYISKKAVYEKNKIPCIYLYPENLGIIRYIFPKRMESLLRKHQMNRELSKFHFAQLKDARLQNIILFLVACLFIYANIPGTAEASQLWLWIGVATAIYQMRLVIISVRNIRVGIAPTRTNFFD